ncbi:HNH endonuclease [Brevundimonas naejangsanensis]|nr:HNH endonuclease [Brevundimonas naejangsanensis]
MTNGYGQTRVKQNGRWRGAGAHQVAYYLAYGRWEAKADGRLVRHLCHNRPCCNPRHLRGGDANDNAEDRIARKHGIDLIGNPFHLPVVGVANRVLPETRLNSIGLSAPFGLPLSGSARDRHPSMSIGERSA